MEPAQAPAPSNTTTVVSSTGLFGTKIPASAAFVIAVLLFLAPFAEVRCNGSALAHNTGLGLAMGTDWKETMDKGLFGNGLNNSTGDFNSGASHEDDQLKKQGLNIFALAALALGVIGLLIAFLSPTGGGKINLVIGIAAAVALIAMLVDLKSKLKSDNSVKSSDMGFNMGMQISVDGTSAYYVTVLLFFAAGIFSYMRVRNKQPT
jgi:hypothetical protein